jgi:hypothetical protein
MTVPVKISFEFMRPIFSQGEQKNWELVWGIEGVIYKQNFGE